MASFNEHWSRVKAGAGRVYTGTRERVRNYKWQRPPRTFFIWSGSILGVIVGAWVLLNLLLANPTTGTPMVNWALGTFGNKNAHVQTGHLKHPFSDTFVLRALTWPGTAQAKEIDVRYDLFGFLPGRIWATNVRVRDGEIILASGQEHSANGLHTAEIRQRHRRRKRRDQIRDQRQAAPRQDCDGQGLIPKWQRESRSRFG